MLLFFQMKSTSLRQGEIVATASTAPWKTTVDAGTILQEAETTCTQQQTETALTQTADRNTQQLILCSARTVKSVMTRDAKHSTCQLNAWYQIYSGNSDHASLTLKSNRNANHTRHTCTCFLGGAWVCIINSASLSNVSVTEGTDVPILLVLWSVCVIPWLLTMSFAVLKQTLNSSETVKTIFIRAPLWECWLVYTSWVDAKLLQWVELLLTVWTLPAIKFSVMPVIMLFSNVSVPAGRVVEFLWTEQTWLSFYE